MLEFQKRSVCVQSVFVIVVACVKLNCELLVFLFGRLPEAPINNFSSTIVAEDEDNEDSTQSFGVTPNEFNIWQSDQGYSSVTYSSDRLSGNIPFY